MTGPRPSQVRLSLKTLTHPQGLCLMVTSTLCYDSGFVDLPAADSLSVTPQGCKPSRECQHRVALVDRFFCMLISYHDREQHKWFFLSAVDYSSGCMFPVIRHSPETVAWSSELWEDYSMHSEA